MTTKVTKATKKESTKLRIVCQPEEPTFREFRDFRGKGLKRMTTKDTKKESTKLRIVC